MQPKAIDIRRLLDVDRQRRIVDAEGFAAHLRGVQKPEENPAETDYDVVHDEDSHRDGEEISRESVEKHAARDKKGAASAGDDEAKAPAENGKGARLDVEA